MTHLAPFNLNTAHHAGLHWSMSRSVNAFKSFFCDCPDIWHFGQFAWLNMARLVGRPGAPIVEPQQFYDDCSKLFIDGKLDEIEPYVRARAVWDKPFLDGLQKICEDRCKWFADAVVAHVRKSGGMKGCYPVPDASHRLWGHQANWFWRPEWSKQPPVPPERQQPAPWYSVVRYDKDYLAKRVSAMRQILDAGYLIVVGVMSGVHPGKAPQILPTLLKPDHYLVIIGYDKTIAGQVRHEFVFWDPDSLESNRAPYGPAFGTLTYYHPGLPAFAAANYPPGKGDAHHRLATGWNDTELQCDSDGRFTLIAPSWISHRYRTNSEGEVLKWDSPSEDPKDKDMFMKKNKRYQVTHLEWRG